MGRGAVIAIVTAGAISWGVGMGCTDERTSPRPVSGPNALLEGFAVPRFDLTKTVEADGTATIEWTAPVGTKTVRCALFWCPPKFEVTEGAADSPTSSLRKISNYYDCMLFNNETRGQSGSLRLGNFPRPRPEPRIADKISGNVSPEFAVGCWSYSEIDINGASLLLAYTPSEVGPLVQYGISPDCSNKKAGSTERYICEIPGQTTTIGWCVNERECTPFCQECADCQQQSAITGRNYNRCDTNDDGIRLCTSNGPTGTTCQ